MNIRSWPSTSVHHGAAIFRESEVDRTVADVAKNGLMTDAVEKVEN
jgi:hypothetical protein